MKVAIGCDHAGYPLKATVLKWLFSHNIEVKDMGTDSATAQVDYPDYAYPVALEVQKGYVDVGILICGTGLGVSITANKVPGIRCAVLTDSFSAHSSREHNNANCIALGARVTGPGVAEEILNAYFSASFSTEERHRRRVEKIELIEKDIAKQYLEAELKKAEEAGSSQSKDSGHAAKASADTEEAKTSVDSTDSTGTGPSSDNTKN